MGCKCPFGKRWGRVEQEGDWIRGGVSRSSLEETLLTTRNTGLCWIVTGTRVNFQDAIKICRLISYSSSCYSNSGFSTLQRVSHIGPLPVFINRVLLEHSHAHSFTYCLSFLLQCNTELSCCDQDYMAVKAETVYSLAFCWQNLPTGALSHIWASNVCWESKTRWMRDTTWNSGGQRTDTHGSGPSFGDVRSPKPPDFSYTHTLRGEKIRGRNMLSNVPSLTWRACLISDSQPWACMRITWRPCKM